MSVAGPKPDEDSLFVLMMGMTPEQWESLGPETLDEPQLEMWERADQEPRR